MKWTDSLCAIYCISLPESKDRRKLFLEEARKHAIPVSIWPAIKNENNPALGLRNTFIEIFQNSVDNNFDHILVFEDDAVFVHDNPNEVMNRAIAELAKDYDMLYLGLNAFGGFSEQYSPTLLKVKAGCTTHAVIYSKQFIKDVLETDIKVPIDMHFAEFHKRGRTYATFPLLCGQRSGYSCIERREVDYSKLIQEKYAEKVQAINKEKI